MASNTENLNLLMKNPSTDGADTFNVQTMLNENWQKIDNNAGTVAQTLANILKPTTPPIIGLPPSTTPDGMFQALGNTGELHVWRKTVVNSQAQDAYYNLGSIIATSGTIIDLSKQNVNQVGFRLSDSVMVLPDGSVSLVDQKMYYKYTYNSNMYQHRFVASDGTYIIDGNFSGKFISFYADSPSYYGSNYITLDKIYYIPATASFTYGAKLTISQLQPVIGHAAITAGTTTTYPVSTNPKAYQEGDDAKAAGYVLEASKQMIAFKTTNSSYKYYAYNYAESISVSDDGTVSLVGALKASGKPFQTDSFNAAKGKFCQFVIEDWFDGYVSTEITGIVFIPSDAVFSVTTLQATCSKVQSVTGYAAIPAGTTIEYLGKLGDKARVQVVSYVGTGTYGSSNPNSLTFDFVPKIVMLFAEKDSNGNYRPAPNSGGWADMFIWLAGMHGTKINGSDVYFTLDGKKLSWYAYSSGAYYQCNSSGSTYIAVAIG